MTLDAYTRRQLKDEEMVIHDAAAINPNWNRSQARVAQPMTISRSAVNYRTSTRAATLIVPQSEKSILASKTNNLRRSND